MAEAVGLKNNVDADDDFRYSTGKGRPSKLFRNASLLLLPLAVFQIVYTYVGNDPYFVRNVMNSTVSLLVSLLVIAWGWVSYSHADDIAALRKHYAEGALNSNNIFVLLAVAIVQHTVCLFELSVTRSWVADNFTATLSGEALAAAIKNESRYEQWNLIAQVITTIYFIIAARLSYKTLYNEEETIGTTLVAGSVVVAAASFALLYFDLHAEYFQDLADVSAHYQQWLLTWAFALAIVFLVLAVAAWLVHHRQWRGVLPFVWVALLIVLFIGIPLAGRSYQNTSEVHATWSGKKGDWVNRLTNVSESYLASEGCPVKYLSDRNSCGYDTSVYPWENTTDPHSQYLECINPVCLGVLGQIYANDFLLVSRTFSIAVAGCFLLLLCLSFQWHHGVSLELQGQKKNFIGVGLIGALLVAFLAVQFTYVAPYPETYPGSADKLRYSNALAAHPALRMVTGFQGFDDVAPFDISEELQDRLFSFVLFQSEKYLILQLASDLESVSLVDSGDWGRNYDDFYNSISKLTHALGLVWVEVAEQRALIGTFYVGNDAPSNMAMVYSEIDKMRDEIEDDDGVAAIITRDIDDLILENALQDHLRMFNTRGSPSFFGYVPVPRVKLPYPNTDAWDNKDLALPGEWDIEINEAVNEMRNFGNPNFVSAVWEEGRWVLAKSGSNVEFAILREAMLDEGYSMTEAVVFFYDFVYEQRHQPIASIVGIDNLQEDQAASLLGFIRALDTVAIPFYPLMEPEYYDLDYLVNFGCIPDPAARIAINDEFLAEVENYLDQM